jgi:hypothetical protein
MSKVLEEGTVELPDNNGNWHLGQWKAWTQNEECFVEVRHGNHFETSLITAPSPVYVEVATQLLHRLIEKQSRTA